MSLSGTEDTVPDSQTSRTPPTHTFSFSHAHVNSHWPSEGPFLLKGHLRAVCLVSGSWLASIKTFTEYLTIFQLHRLYLRLFCHYVRMILNTDSTLEYTSRPSHLDATCKFRTCASSSHFYRLQQGRRLRMSKVLLKIKTSSSSHLCKKPNMQKVNW